VNRDDAETLALLALGHLAADPAAAGAFLAASGLGPADIRARARDPDFLAAVLDFLMADEGLLVPFLRAQGIGADRIWAARRALPGGDDPHWT
jgi:hypothetical protein